MNLRVKLLSFVVTLAVMNTVLRAENEGLDKLDEATSLKMGAESQGDLGKVVELCEEALELGLDEGNALLAKQVLAASAYTRADSLFQQLPRVANNRDAVRRLRRRTMSDLDKAIEHNPKLAKAFVLRARVENLPGGSRDNALKDLNSAIELFKDKPVDQSQAYILRAMLREDNETRLADLAKAIDADSTNAQAWQARIQLQMAMGKLEEAVQDAEALLDKDESNMFALLAAVESLNQLQKTDEAINLLTKRIEQDSEGPEVDPKDGIFYRVRARAYMIQEDEEKAIADLNKAIEINSRDSEALVRRGQIYYDQSITDQDSSKLEKANRDISDSLLIEPGSVQGVWMRSMIAAREGRFADAITDMEMLVRADHTNVFWIRRLASYYQMDDRPRLAISLLDEMLRNNDQEWKAMRMRGDARLSISQHAEAIEDFENAIRILEASGDVAEFDEPTKDDYSGLLNNLAWVLATSPKDDLRNGEQAVEMGLKACEVTEYKQAHILSTLGAAYAEIGDFENARKWSAKSVELGEADGNDQLDQLKEELESYQQDKPWREEQSTEENDKPLSAASETIDT